MIRLTYDSDHLRGALDCPFCGKSYRLEGNVRAWKDENGAWKTHPEARGKVYAHFHYDRNAWIDECAQLAKVRSTTWEAVDVETGTIVARGRVEVLMLRTSIGPISVEQDDPPV